MIIEGQGDDTRTWGPPYVEDQSAYFLSVNRNKRSIAIDMSRSQGQTIIREVGCSMKSNMYMQRNLFDVLL